MRTLLQLTAGAEEVAVFGAASESFTKKNVNCTIAESLNRFQDVMDAAKKEQVKVRGYVSTVVGKELLTEFYRTRFDDNNFNYRMSLRRKN